MFRHTARGIQHKNHVSAFMIDAAAGALRTGNAQCEPIPLIVEAFDGFCVLRFRKLRSRAVCRGACRRLRACLSGIGLRRACLRRTDHADSACAEPACSAAFTDASPGSAQTAIANNVNTHTANAQMARYRSSARRLCFAIPVVPPSRRRVMAPRFPSSDAASVPETARSVVDSGSVKSAPRCAEPPYSPRIMGTGRLLPRQTCPPAWFWRLAILPRSPLDSADFSPISRICPNLGHSVTRKISCWSRTHRKLGAR